jgi:hypothetical protein
MNKSKFTSAFQTVSFILAIGIFFFITLTKSPYSFHSQQLVNAVFFYTFITFGLCSILILLLIYRNLFPANLRTIASFGAVAASAMQWAILIFDVTKYDLPWYYGFLLPFWAITSSTSYQSFAFSVSLVAMPLLIVSTTYISVLFLIRNLESHLSKTEPPQDS